jgi:FMN phosphatase YigB (HAD superfamily)
VGPGAGILSFPNDHFAAPAAAAPAMKHRLFLFDLDDTLLDFKASERLSFDRTMHALGLAALPDGLFGSARRSTRQASTSTRKRPAACTWNRCRTRSS